jgi:hypothetical protein
MNNVSFYIFALLAIVIGVLLFKKVLTCLMRSIVILMLLAALAVAYYFLVYTQAPQS